MKIGILGAGWGARVQLPLLRMAGFSELLLWGRSPEKARAAAAANGAAALDDWRAVIAASDLVFVTTPVFQHREMVLAALEAGRHVICEKPFALNETEAAEMATAAALAKRTHPACKAFVDHELRLLPGRRKLRELIRAGEGYHLWSETYDGKMEDIFKTQDEIAAEVVRELKVKLLAPAPKVRTTDPQAYALFLQARALSQKFTPDAFAKSDALFRQVLEIDPRYAPAWNSLGVNFNYELGMGVMSSREGNARAREAAEKALEIDPEYAPAHAALALIATQSDNDLAGAARHLERALTLDSTGSANLLSSLGRLDQAQALYEAAARRDPLSVAALSNLGAAQCVTGRYDEAIGSYRAVLRLSPSRGGAHAQLGMVLLQKGDASAALAEIEQEKNETWRMIVLPMAYCALGRAADAEAARNALIAKYEKDWSYNIAYVYAVCGQRDKAFEWLDKAVAYQDAGLSEIVAQNLFDKIHSDPRWLPFLRKIGKAPDQLARIEFKLPPLPQ